MALPSFERFSVSSDSHSVGIRWDKYVNKIENLFVGLNVETKKRRKALLLHYAGDEVYEIYETLDLNNSDSNYDETKAALKQHFSANTNTEFEKFEFRNLQQQQGESIDQFTTRLRQKATHCAFGNKDDEIKSQFIQGVSSQKLRIRCLESSDKPLSDLLKIARTMDLAQAQAESMSREQFRSQEHVDKIHKRPSTTSKPNSSQRNTPTTAPRQENSSQIQRASSCRNCGGPYPHMNGRCPAIGSKCNYCHKVNHFIAVCRKRLQSGQRRVREINAEQGFESRDRDSNSEEEYLYGLSVNAIGKKKVPLIRLKIQGAETSVLVDTGSSINVVSESILSKMTPRPKPQKAQIKAYAFGQNTSLPVQNTYTLSIESDKKFATAVFHTIKGSSETLISYETAVELGIVPVINSVKGCEYSELCEKYKSVFTGLGKLKDKQIKFHIDESVVPSSQPARRIPFHVREQVEQELDRLEELDVIEKVDGPTPWVSNLVVAPKPNAPNEIRLCVDMRKANLALKRERHVTPTIDDIVSELNGSTVFSKVDLYKGFHQLELSEESRNMTVFASHVGLRRYKRLNFGVSVAPEIFQNEIRQALQGLQKTLNISDDIIVHGKTRQEHDKNLEALLQRLQEKGLTLNERKCEFGQSKLKFYGYIFSDSGISPDPEKIVAIQNIDRPKNQAEIRSFLGMTNYVSRFIRNYSTISEPLRRLTQEKAAFEWTNQQETAFRQLQNALSSDQVMTYFDPSKDTELWVDASPVGVSGILNQDSKIIAYGGRSLTPVEQRYSQTEREALACVWGCQHFHLYLFGKAFTLVSDHRCLESIFNNTKQIQSARLERWRLRLTTYNFKVKYRAGNQMISDYCSRHPIQESKADNVAEEYVNFLASNSVPKSLTLSEVARATQTDCVIQCVIQAVENNTWYKQRCSQTDSYRCYLNVREELTVVSLSDGHILLRGTRLCIPESLQHQVINLAHEGHQGRVRCKSLLRETCWFPYMDKLIDDKCKQCIPCMSASNETVHEPIKPSPLPKRQWDCISVDFCGPMPSGEYFMVVICDYCRYPVVEKLNSVSAQAVIPLLERIFALFAIPNVVKTDNGSPFNSHTFAEFADQLGFKHRKITPLHPASNGTAEAFMKPLVKCMKTAAASGQNYKSELSKFLLNYRSTPHPSTGISPFELMFNRKMKTKIPQFSVPPSRNRNYVKERDAKVKQKNKQYADKRNKARTSTLRPGDKVLVKQQVRNKLDTPFSPVPGSVVSRKGSMVTVRHKDRTLTRDASHFKPVLDLPPSQDDNVRQEIAVQQPVQQPRRRSNREKKPPRKYGND